MPPRTVSRLLSSVTDRLSLSWREMIEGGPGSGLRKLRHLCFEPQGLADDRQMDPDLRDCVPG